MSAPFHHEVPGQERFEDILVCDTFPAAKIIRLRDMDFLPTDVIVASYPKTGTTFLQEIVYLIRNGADVEQANKTRTFERVPFIELGQHDNFAAFENLPHPRTVKTHVPYRFLPKTARDGSTKVVYIIRNPKDALVSYYHFYRMNRVYNNFKGTWTDYFNYFMAQDAMVGYGNPFDHFRGYWEHKNDPNICIVFYEQLVRNPVKEIRKIAQFLTCDLNDEDVEKIAEATSFRVMKQNPMTNAVGSDLSDLNHSISPFMRKGKVGDWKQYFTEEQNRIMAEMEKERLAGLDLELIYE